MTAAKARVDDDKLYLILPDETAFTAEGYILVSYDLPIDKSTSDVLKTKPRFVKPGIYKGTYDENKNKYVGVVLDLK